jgi:Tfp pilus assembly protein PilN
VSRWHAVAGRFRAWHTHPERAPDSFNVLPYRRVRALAARRRYRAEFAGAMLMGLVAAAGGVAWHERDVEHMPARRAALEETLGRLAPRLAQVDRLAAREAAGHERAALLAASAEQRDRLVRLLAALSRGVPPGIALADLRHHGDLTTAQGEAANREALERWIRTLNRLPGVDAVRVAQLRGPRRQDMTDPPIVEHAENPAGNGIGAVSSPLEFDLRIVYRASSADAPRPRGMASTAGLPG